VSQIEDRLLLKRGAVPVLVMEYSLRRGDHASNHKKVPKLSSRTSDRDVKSVGAESECFLLGSKAGRYIPIGVESARFNLGLESVSVLGRVVLDEIGEESALQYRSS
jgi:hypothetical protein